MVNRTAGAVVLSVLIFPFLFNVTGKGVLSIAVAPAVSVTILLLTEDRGNYVWEAVPKKDYMGRYAELGGITRKEEDEAVKEVRDGAERQGDR
jgi:hypothetical protein